MTANSRADELSLIGEPSVVHTLRVTLAAVVASALAISGFTLFLNWRLTPQFAFVVSASSLVALVLSRSGRITLAMMLPLLSITYVVLHLAVRSDGIQNIGLSILPVLIIVCSLVLNRLTLVLFTAGIILAVVGMLAIRYFVLLAERYSSNDMGDLLVFAFTCATAALVGRLLTLRIKDAFLRERASCQALGVAERNVRLVADSLSEMVLAYDMHRSLTYANTGAEKLSGYGSAELQGMDPLSWTHPEDRAQVLTLWDKAFDGQTIDQVVYRLITKDGTVRWAAGSWGPVVDETGHQVGVRATCIDITERMVTEEALQETTQKYRTIVEEIAERKLAETALRESEERFRAIFSQAAVGIAQTGLDAKCLLLNARFCEILGYTQAELSGKTFLDVTHPDDREASSTAVRRLLAGDISSWSTEKRYVRKGGTIVWARVFLSLVRDQHHLPQYFIAVVEDITDRIQAENALQESERRLMLALSAGVGMWDCDLRAEVAVLSPQYSGVFGQPPLTPAEWFKLVHLDDRERVIALVRESIRKVSDWDAEFRLLGPDGSVRWMLTKGTVLLGDDGRPDRMVGVSLDITERKRAEESLRVSQERFDLAQEASGTGTWDWDATTDETHCSSGHGPLYGLPPSDRAPSGEEWLELIHPEDRARMRQELDRTLESADHFITEFRVVWPDGTIHWLYGKGQVFRDSRGNPIRMIGVNMDVSERKRVEADLRESEERFRNMADTAPVMIWVAGPDKLCTFFNKCCLDFTGHSLEQKIGEGWIAGVHPEDRERFLARYADSFDARREFQTVFRLRRADGEYRFMLTTGAPRFKAGVFAGFIGSCVDITELKRTQEEALARQKLESLGVLAGGIAHDFNNVLGGILGQAELVEQELSMGSSPGEEIQRIKTAVIRGAEIVRELMVYTGQQQAGLVEPVDLSRLVEEMLELLKVSISKHAVLNINLDENLPAVPGNAPQIRQVVMNLVINASEAIGEKEGVIRVATSRVTGSPDSVLTNAANLPPGDYVRLEVSDTGCGLTEEAKAKIFDPFFTTKFAGRGLGLAVVQGIVRAHGGAIDVISAPQGAKFQVLLRCTSKEPLEIQNSIASYRAEQSNALAGTVLVVEDEELLRRAVSKVLRQRGFSVMEVSDGSAAIDLICTCKDNIDLIVLDVTLPGRPSREVLEAARRMRPEVKIILTSAYGKENVDATFAGLRVEHFIRKPFHLADLVACLQEALAS